MSATLTRLNSPSSIGKSIHVPPGYNWTDVGVIPEDWRPSKLRDCCIKITDGTHDTPKTVQSGVPFLTAIHIKDNWIDYQSCLYVTQADHDIIYSRCDPAKNDVLMVNIGAGVATTAIVSVDYEFSLKNVALLKPDKRRTVGSYLNYSLANRKHKITQDLSSGGAQPFLSLAQIGEITIPLPPTKSEQNAIADTLSDVDALVGALEKLIVKKRAIKQAAMQQLLTGKTRLPGFSGRWEEKPLSELAGITMGQSPPSQFYNLRGDGLPLIQGNADIEDRQTIERVWTTQASKCCDAGDLVLTVRAPVGAVGIATIAACLGRGVCGLKPYASSPFLFQALIFEESRWKILEQGSTFTSANSMQVGQFRVWVPEDVDEQMAIAAVLSDIDAEIAALEQRRDKTKAIKQGMMQELLTGRVRLVNGEAKA